MHRYLQILLASSFCLVTANSFAAAGISINQKDGLPVLGHDGVQLLSADYEFWAKDYKWAGQKTRVKTKAPFHYSTSAHNKKLDFRLRSEIKKVDNNKLVWEYTLDAKNQKSDVIGGGISFKLNLSESQNDLGVPSLLPDNQGFTWGSEQDKGIEVRFEPPLKSIYFERSKKSRIRAFFYSGEVPAGELKHSMTVTLFGDIKIRETLGERFGTAHSAKWPKDLVDWQSFPVDLSFLNAGEKPAGKRGFIKAQGEQLVFEDNTTARFWGTNITAATLFRTAKSNVKKQARRLSRMGFNLVRLHHHDSVWVNPNVFGSRDRKDTQQLSSNSLDKLDWWIKCLKDEGIYVWLDLHVQRRLKKADNIFAFEEIRKKTKDKYKGADLKGYNYVNSSIQNAMQQFNLAFVAHVNPYTDLAYKDEPAIVAMLLTNENDVTTHFGNRLLPNKNVPEHNQIYMREANEFATRNGLPAKTTWHSWKHGPSKLFLNDLEHRFNRDMINGLRTAGVKVPLVTTNTWGNNPLSSLPALTTGDMIDVHAYGGSLEVSKNPLKVAGMTAWMAAGQVANKPMSVTEWNVSPFPVPDRHASSLLVASKAAHQGWDAMMLYAYSQNSLDKVGKPSNWHAHNDPAMLAVMPSAALMYRQGHVTEATSTYYLAPGTKLYDRSISAGSSVAIRTASEKGKLVVAMPKTESLPWLVPSSAPAGAVVINDHKQTFIERGSTSVTSDTGELRRDWKKGVYTIDTERSQAVMGWLRDNPIKLADSIFDIKTRNASVVVQSLDENAIKNSRRILISLASNSVPYRGQSGKSELPFHTEPVTGNVTVTAGKGLRLYYLDQRGIKHILEVEFNNGEYLLDLEKYPLAHWLLLTDEVPGD